MRCENLHTKETGEYPYKGGSPNYVNVHEWVFTSIPGILIKSKVFDVENGNDDRNDLANPSNYGLENTINVIFNPFNDVDGTDRIAGWFIRWENRIPMLLYKTILVRHCLKLNVDSRTLGESKKTLSRAPDDSESCEDQSCVQKPGDLFGVGELTKDDCVFLLLHGNAKVIIPYPVS